MSDKFGTEMTLAEEWDAARSTVVRLLCEFGSAGEGPDPVAASDHGHTQCWALGVAIRGADECDAWRARAERAEADADRLAQHVFHDGKCDDSLPKPCSCGAAVALTLHYEALAQR